jgi:glycosyltransferase involved in cell wall biosynthesis
MILFLAFRIFVLAPSALLTDHRPHGDGLVAWGFIRELAARGHELEVAARAVDLGGPVPSSVEVHALGPARGPALARRALFMRRTRALFARLGAGRGFDLVHQLNPVDVGVSLALAGGRTPVVLGPYVPDWPTGASGPRGAAPVKRLLRAAQQRRAAAVLLSSPAALVKIDGPHRRLRVCEVPPGLDDRRWVPGPGAAGGEDVLFLANLQARKGIHVALEAFERLAADRPRARLLVAGAGPEEAAVRRRIADMAAGGRVRLLGRLGRDDVLSAMQRCAVYCLPSFGEPFGMTALEAMACGRPVVGTDAGGLRHLVRDGGGRRVPPGDPAALAAALGALLADESLRREMGRHNRDLVERRYAWPRVTDRLEEAYRLAVSRPTPAAAPP